MAFWWHLSFHEGVHRRILKAKILKNLCALLKILVPEPEVGSRNRKLEPEIGSKNFRFPVPIWKICTKLESEVFIFNLRLQLPAPGSDFRFRN